MATDSQQLEQDQNDSHQEAPTAADQPEAQTEQSQEVSPEPQEGSGQDGQAPTKSNLEHILSMKLPVIVRIAQKRMRIKEVLKLNLGSVVHFDQDAYQQIDLLVNNQVIGLGQPVKIGENFGLKVLQIGDITDTIRILGDAADEQADS